MISNIGEVINKLYLLFCNAEDLGSIPGLPTPIIWPGEFHGLYSPWGRKETDTTE